MSMGSWWGRRQRNSVSIPAAISMRACTSKPSPTGVGMERREAGRVLVHRGHGLDGFHRRRRRRCVSQLVADGCLRRTKDVLLVTSGRGDSPKRPIPTHMVTGPFKDKGVGRRSVARGVSTRGVGMIDTWRQSLTCHTRRILVSSAAAGAPLTLAPLEKATYLSRRRVLLHDSTSSDCGRGGGGNTRDSLRARTRLKGRG